MRKHIVFMIVMALGAVWIGSASATTNQKVTICHRTASYSNPYVQITVDRHAVDGVAGNSGHQADHFGEHQGPVFSPSLPKHTEWGDIIPPVSPYHNGLNWTTAGQAIYNNGCKIPAPPVVKPPVVNPPPVVTPPVTPPRVPPAIVPVVAKPIQRCVPVHIGASIKIAAQRRVGFRKLYSVRVTVRNTGKYTERFSLVETPQTGRLTFGNGSSRSKRVVIFVKAGKSASWLVQLRPTAAAFLKNVTFRVTGRVAAIVPAGVNACKYRPLTIKASATTYEP